MDERRTMRMMTGYGRMASRSSEGERRFPLAHGHSLTRCRISSRMAAKGKEDERVIDYLTLVCRLFEAGPRSLADRPFGGWITNWMLRQRAEYIRLSATLPPSVRCWTKCPAAERKTKRIILSNSLPHSLFSLTTTHHLSTSNIPYLSLVALAVCRRVLWTPRTSASLRRPHPFCPLGATLRRTDPTWFAAPRRFVLDPLTRC